MLEARLCPKCGATLRADAPGGMCLRCLGRLAAAGPEPDTLGEINPDPDLDEPAMEARPGAGATPTARPRQVGDYELIEELGRGGMGVVWRGRQPSLGREVALKLIQPGMDSGQVLARFEAERQALARMDHSNIARVFDAGTTLSGRPYFVMELVEGVPITRYCDEQRLGIHGRLELFIAVCRAIEHAHQKGIIHRDIKPGNVLVALREGRPVPKVIDFGVAKAVGEGMTVATYSTEAGALVGTLQYMAPEQAGGGGASITPQADVYSLGAVLFECLAGVVPFSGRDSFELIQAIVRRAPPRPRRLNPKIARDLEVICLKCLEKSPAHRYPSAAALANDIERWLNGEPIQAQPVGPIERAVKWTRRHPVTAGLLASVVVCAVLAVATVALWRGNERAEARQRQAAAERFFADGDEPRALATLARWLRDDPGSREASGRLLAALALRAFFVPVAEMTITNETAGEAPSPDSTRVIHRLEPPTGFAVSNRFGGVAFTVPDAHTMVIRSWTWSADGRIVTAAADGKVKFWDGNNGKFLGEMPVGKGLAYGEFAASGTHLLTVVGEAVQIWDWSRLAPVGNVMKHPSLVGCARFSPDGRQVLTAADDGVVRLWEAGSGVLLGQRMHALATPDLYENYEVRFLDGGRCWVRLHRRAVVFCMARAPAEVSTLPQDRSTHSWLPDLAEVLSGLCFGPDGREHLVGLPASISLSRVLESKTPLHPLADWAAKLVTHE